MEESLEHIRESAETRMRKNAFMLHNYIELERVEKDRAVFKLDIRPESCNPYGLIHGGAIYTLADNATRLGGRQRRAVLRHTDQRAPLPAQPGHRDGAGLCLGPAPWKVHGAHRCGHHWRGRQAAGHGGVHLLLRRQGADGPEGGR